MRILLVNQTYLPDLASTAQHLGDLARCLARRGHEVRVLASRRCYEDPTRVHPRHEQLDGVEIRRIGIPGFGKKTRWRRIADSISFFVSLLLVLLTEPKPDVAVSLTSPPLLPVLVAGVARLRGIRFVYWAMDLNPEEAIALGYLRADSALAGRLLAMAGWAFRQADAVIALDEYMAAHIRRYGVAPPRIVTIPPWAHHPAAISGAAANRFRLRYNLGTAFVVMYSGNHSPCHPLDTLLGAVLELRHEPDIIFCFVGGGNGKATVRAFRDEHHLDSIRDLPYQPFDELPCSLSAADLHVVVMGEPFVGIVHPCKIYGVLAVGAPVLFIGPRHSHIGDILSQDARAAGQIVAHGDIAGAVNAIQQARARRLRSQGHEIIGTQFDPQTLRAAVAKVIEESRAAGAPA